jgi:hypothetical protein
MAYKLPQAAVRKIEAAVDDLFDRAKVRFLGPRSVDKKLYIGFQRPTSLPGIFEQAVAEEGGIPDLETLEQLISSAGNYMDSLRLRAKAKVVNAVQAFMSESAGPGSDSKKLQSVLGGELADLFASIKSDMNRIVDTESQKARNIGQLDGIVRVNASVGVDDPLVFFVVVRDNELCDECRKLHMLPDGKTPRVWKLSQLGHGYHKRGDPQPKISGLHPHCRCSMTTLMPGFGFNEAGFVAWKGEGHDEYEEQQGA